MAHTIYAGNVSKRKNSTLQPSLSASFDVLLKTPTSLHTPTFTINAGSFDYNYLKWNDRYYFVTDVVSRNNNLWEVSAVCDVLATYKAEILASTQYVSYSANGNDVWLPDNRIATDENIIVTKNAATVPLFSLIGCYILTVIGKNGCESFNVTSGTLMSICADVAQWVDDIQALIEQIQNMDTSAGNAWDAIGHLGELMRAIALAMVKTGFLGNSREDALNCIRSCVWLPFDSSIVGGASDSIYLGKYPTNKSGLLVTNIPKTNSVSVAIPWHFSDYRRATNEDLYLYLPFIGNVSLSSSSLTSATTLTVNYSYCIDGSLTYEVKAGNQVIGTYGGNVAGTMPIGTAQTEGLGKIFTTSLSHIQKAVGAGISAASGNIGAAADLSALGKAASSYDIINTSMTTHAGAIGGVTCGAGAGLDKDVICYSVAHPTNIEPATMAATMGRPYQKPATLGSLTGYCQCANAHVAAAAESQELDEIDAFLNGGFYIE